MLFNKQDVWFLWSLKILAISFRSVSQKFYSTVVESKIFRLWPDISFDSGFQKIVLSSLLLFPCACY